MFTELDSSTQFLIGVLFLLVGIWIAAWLTVKLICFSRERDSINMEIQRTTGAERAHWKRKRRRLWLMFLPFYRK